MKTLLISILVMLALQGCSQKQLYQTVQQSQTTKCLKYVGPEREACERQLNEKSYEEYKRSKEELKAKKSEEQNKH